MSNQFRKLKNGNTIYRLDGKEEYDVDCIRELMNTDISELLRLKGLQDSTSKMFLYKTNGMKNISEYLENATESKILNTVLQLCKIKEVMKENSINEDYLTLDKDYIFVNKTGELKFIVVPVRKISFTNTSLFGFIKDIVISSNYSDSEDLDYVARLLISINKNIELKNLSIFTEYLIERDKVRKYEKTEEKDELFENIENDNLELQTDSNNQSDKQPEVQVNKPEVNFDMPGKIKQEEPEKKLEDLSNLEVKIDISDDDINEEINENEITEGKISGNSEKLFDEPEETPEPETPAEGEEQTKSFAYIIRLSNGEKVPITKDDFHIGKEEGNDYIINDNGSISKNHLKIIYDNGEYFAIDNDSTNGSYINKIIMDANKQYPLNNNDILHLSNEDFKFVLSV